MVISFQAINLKKGQIDMTCCLGSLVIGHLSLVLIKNYGELG